MADKNIIIGRVINVTGMIGVVAGNLLIHFRNWIARISAWLWL